jgi:hypothetical protein
MGRHDSLDNTENGRRICVGDCKRMLPLSKEFFTTINTKGKLSSICKDCKAAKNREYYKDKPRPVSLQFFTGHYLCRYKKREDIWKIYWQKPWRHLADVKTEVEAREWCDKY